MTRYSDLRQKMADAEISILLRIHAPDSIYKIYGEYAVNPLITALRDANRDVRWRAAEALGKIKDAAAVPALIIALGDPKSNVREIAANALGQIKDARAVPALIIALGDTDSNVRNKAVEALGKIGKPAVPALIIALGDLDPRVKWNAAWVLGKIKDVSAVPALIIALGDADPNVRWRMAEALGRIGDDRGLRFTKLIGNRDVNHALEIGLEETRKVLAEFVKIIEKDRDLAKTNRLRLELAEFYGQVVVEHNKRNSGIKVEGGELLRDTVKPPKDGMYRAMERRAMRRT